MWGHNYRNRDPEARTQNTEICRGGQGHDEEDSENLKVTRLQHAMYIELVILTHDSTSCPTRWAARSRPALVIPPTPKRRGFGFTAKL
jgi:hypothetical protein